MKLTFSGTRGYIEAKSSRYRRHSALIIEHHNQIIMVDCGEDWTDRVFRLAPDTIIITHGHPDHAWGLQNGSPCPVYATAETWENFLDQYELNEKYIISPEESFTIADITFEAFNLEHSTRAPAVGFRIHGNSKRFFYAPDVVYIHNREKALSELDLYIGDGTTIDTYMVRKQDENLIGHTPVRTQLTWCQKFDIPQAIFTHCGSELVEGDERTLGSQNTRVRKRT
jgi:phosphoribosyl 1,2-cyclic phosphodiesterase